MTPSAFRPMTCALITAWPVMAMGQPGSPDPDFGDQGTVLMPLVEPFIQNSVGPMVEYPDGKILLAGGIFVTGPADIYLARITADGAMDAGFGTGGVRLHSIGAWKDHVGDMILLPDGRFLLAGSADDTAVVSRYFANGDPDPTFGTNGLRWLGLAEASADVRSMRRMTDGRLTLLLTTDTSIHLARMLPDGALDSGFSGDGVVQVATVPGAYADACMGLDGQGNILLARKEFAGADAQVVIERWTVSGTLDPAFGEGGHRIINLSEYTDAPWSVVPLPNGDALFTGSTWTTANESAFVARLDPNGDLVPAYGSDGIALLPALDDSSFILPSAVVQPDGSLIMAGLVSHWGIGTIATVRLTPNGTMDPTYGTNGLALSSDPDPNGEGASHVILTASGSAILTIGSGGLYRGAARKILTGLEVGIPERGLTAEDLHVFPNPASRNAVAAFTLPRAGRVFVALLTLDGRVIQAAEYKGRSGSNALPIEPPGGLANGNYILRITTPEGIRSTPLVVADN